MKKYINILLASFLLISFSTLPARNAAAFSVGEEREVGEKLLYTVRSSFEVLDQPDIQQYIDKLGEEVIEVAGVQFFKYHFFVINNKDFNAFAAPSGLIFFHSGLIEKMNGENEFISVLAHEIGHIVKRHISSRIDRGRKISVATMGLILASIALGGGAASEALMAGSMAAGQSANLHFSRQDEEEADLLAYDWMIKLRRHPDGQVNMLRTMRQIARYRSTQIPQYLLTHPNPEARLDYVQTLVDKDRTKVETFSRGDSFEFLRFKYRIMSQTKDSMYFRGLLSSILTNPRSNDMDKIMAKYGLSLLYKAENNYDSAIASLDEVITELGEKNILLTDKGVIELESGNTEMAFTTLNNAYNDDRTNMYAAYSLAKASFTLGKLERAHNLFTTVMYKLPEFSQVYFELGRLSSTMKKPAATKYYLGKYYLTEGKVKIARKNLQEAVKDEKLELELKADAENTLELIKRLLKK